jgi:ribosome-associated protein
MPITGRKVTRDGVLVITAARFRTQERKRDDALERLLSKGGGRHAQPKASRERRLSDKARRSRLMRLRSDDRVS